MAENHNSVNEFISEIAREKPQEFSYEQLKSFTSNFQFRIGFGGFGDVYKGEFPDGVQVAVKVLKNTMMDVMKKQFMSEVGTMGRTYHRNLIKLYGFCFDVQIKALVYEYMEKGSFDRILYENDPDIKWEALYNIAIDIAKGLSYLHEHCSPQIIHHDIKPANVLLDSNLCPKITDFGLAKLNRNLSHFAQTGYRGTPGYAAPEVCLNHPSITCKCDVYSYGIMLFEILTRKKCSEGEKWFPQQVWKHLQNGQLDKIIMECCIGVEDKEDAETISKVALLCVQNKAQDRPSMSTVFKMLEGEIPPWTPVVDPFPYHYSSSDSRSRSAHRGSTRIVFPAYDERLQGNVSVSSHGSSSSSEAREPEFIQGVFLKKPIVHDQRNMNQIQNSERTIIDRLTTTRDVVKRLIDAALNNNQVIREPVQIWVQKVEIVLEEDKQLSDEAGLVNNFFFFNNHLITGGWCCARFSLGRKSDKKNPRIQALLEEGNTFGDIVLDPKPVQSLEIVSSGDFDAFASRESTTKKIVEALEDGKIGLIGVFGMPGVGKTMLLDAVSKMVKKERMFDEVVKVIVSQNPDLEKIQDNIAIGLDMGFGSRDNSFTKKEKLNERIICSGKKTLVVLDDVWERLEIAEVGIPHKDTNKDCKVVFTTRDQGVCGNMESDVSIEVTILTEEDSWQLFRKKIGGAPQNSNLLGVAKDIANECKGLPLAIATLGRALRYKDENIWNDAFLLLRKSNFTGLSLVFSSIKMSYDFLSSEEKKMCFLFCCLYPEDYKIDTNNIFFHVMGEKLLRNTDTFLEARSIFHLIVDELVSSCLLLRDEEGYVMLHDVVRDVAISIASAESNKFIVKAGMNLTEWPDVELGNCNRLSLMSNKITCFPSYQIKAPNLLTLCLNKNSGIAEIPSDFFKGMQNLKTLDMSNTMVKSLPPSFSCLRSLRVLCMDNCWNLVDISQIERLDRLEILSIRDSCGIKSWESLGKLTTLKMLDLSINLSFLSTHRRYSRRSFLPHGEVISNLHRLEELRIIGYMRGDDVDRIDDNDDGDRRDEYGDQSYFIGLSEIACLTRLTCLHMTLSTDKCNSQEQEVLPSHWANLTESIFVCHSRDGTHWPNLLTRDGTHWTNLLTDECNSQVELPSHWEKLTEFAFVCHSKNYDTRGFQFLQDSWNLKKKSMALQLPSISVPNWIRVLSGWTNCLYLAHCYYLKSVDQLDPSGMFDNLKVLWIKRCKLMTHLYSTTASSCKAKAPMYAFRNLERLKLFNLNELVAFCNRTLPQGFFQNLKFLEVGHCWKVVILIPCDLLERLQNLEKLKVVKCFGMEKVVQLTSNATQSMSSSGPSFPIFPNLRELYIKDCWKLKYLLPMRVLRELRQLEKLEIYSSDSMVMIVEEDEVVDVDQDKAILPRLKSLDLVGLWGLMSFGPSSLLFDWPALEYLGVIECSKLKRLPLHTNSAPKLRTLEVKQQWFDGLEWEDESLKSRLQSLLPKQKSN